MFFFMNEAVRLESSKLITSLHTVYWTSDTKRFLRAGVYTQLENKSLVTLTLSL